jgi:hypothetical protein
MKEADDDPSLMYFTNKLYYLFKFIVSFLLLFSSLPYSIIYEKSLKTYHFSMAKIEY